jgi:hypothetical protein
MNNTTGNTARYTVTFHFLEPAPPTPNRLVLVVSGLHRDTTATVSQSGVGLGEIDLPVSGGITSSPTALTGGNVLKSGYISGSNPATDLPNTGWFLFQPTLASATLAVQLSHAGGDGIGLTLGYVVRTAPPQPAAVDPCCPPWNASLLKEMMFYNGQGSISLPYTLKFLPTAAFNSQMKAYIDYLHTLNPAMNAIIIDWRLHDQGNGTLPNPNGPQGAPLATGNTTWNSPGGGPVNSPPGLFTGFPMQVGYWYMVHTGIYLANGQKFFPEKCANNEIFVLIKTIGGRIKGSPVLEFSDGKRVIKTVSIQ